MENNIELNTAWLLHHWALWCNRGSGVDLRSKGCLSHVVPCAPRELPPVCEITDTDALRVDRAMAQLNVSNRKFYETLYLTFRCDYSDRRLAAYFEITRYAAAQLYEQAYCWIDRELTQSNSKAA